MKTKHKFLMGIKIIAGIILFVIVFGFGTMHLWNWLVPSLFHGPVITFAEAIGLLILSKILFGGGHHFGRGRHCGRGHRHWKHRVHEHFEHMSEDEKAAFKQRFKDYWWFNTYENFENMSGEEKAAFKQGFKGQCGSKWGISKE